jgi:ribonuclease BN (tRNA processing enzyme)
VKIRVLGASGSEVAGHLCPAFAVDDSLLLDAGTVAVSLNITEESRIRHILISHAHFDHIKGIPFLLDNLFGRDPGAHVTVVAGPEVIDDLKRNILNDRIWPDFSRIPTPEIPVLRYAMVRSGRPERIGAYRVTAESVTHTVPAYGFILEDADGKVLAYTGDTGPTDSFWRRMNHFRVDCLIVEASFPNRMEIDAVRSGHLTPSLLGRELAKMRPIPGRIRLIHAKPQHQAEIENEIRTTGLPDIRFLREGERFEI